MTSNGYTDLRTTSKGIEILSPADLSYKNRFAFHSFDVLAGLRDYGIFSSTLDLPLYQPHQCDLQYGDIVRQGWTQLAHTGRLDPTSPGGWNSINDTDDFPSSYNVGIIGSKVNGCSRSPAGQTEGQTCHAQAQTINNFKRDTCQFWTLRGIDQRYWWAN